MFVTDEIIYLIEKVKRNCQTREEKLRKKREAERRRYKRIRNDEELWKKRKESVKKNRAKLRSGQTITRTIKINNEQKDRFELLQRSKMFKKYNLKQQEFVECEPSFELAATSQSFSILSNDITPFIKTE